MISVLLAEDHKIVREGLCHLLGRDREIRVVAEAETGLQTVLLTKQLLPDVVVMDLSMPVMNGIEATRVLVREIPDCRVLVLSMHSDASFVVEALKAGALGYILKDCASENLVEAIHSVAHWEPYLSQNLAGVLGVLPLVNSTRIAKISSRECEVLQLLAEGNNTKEIAFRLDISTKTVETHRKQIMTKLGIRSVAELTKYAVREGLTSLA